MSIKVSDSQSSGSVGVPLLVGVEHSSLTAHLGADHELDTISDRESAVLGLMVLDLDEFDLRNGPSLVIPVVTLSESKGIVVSISWEIKAEALIVSDVSLATGVEVKTLLLFSLPWSGDDCLGCSESLTGLV